MQKKIDTCYKGNIRIAFCILAISLVCIFHINSLNANELKIITSLPDANSDAVYDSSGRINIVYPAKNADWVYIAIKDSKHIQSSISESNKESNMVLSRGTPNIYILGYHEAEWGIYQNNQENNWIQAKLHLPRDIAYDFISYGINTMLFPSVFKGGLLTFYSFPKDASSYEEVSIKLDSLKGMLLNPIVNSNAQQIGLVFINQNNDLCYISDIKNNPRSLVIKHYDKNILILDAKAVFNKKIWIAYILNERYAKTSRLVVHVIDQNGSILEEGTLNIKNTIGSLKIIPLNDSIGVFWSVMGNTLETTDIQGTVFNGHVFDKILYISQSPNGHSKLLDIYQNTEGVRVLWLETYNRFMGLKHSSELQERLLRSLGTNTASHE